MRKISILLTLFAIFTTSAFSQQKGPTVGDKAPEVKQKLISGEDFQLSDLKGKLVLLDFWASWCKPCRKESPALVALYNEYKDEEFENAQGFVIVSVSLDFKHEMWERAIEKDNLTWRYHIGGGFGWKNPVAQDYHVKSIPTSFLIDGEGTIIATHLRGEELEKAIKKQRKRKSFFFSSRN